MTDWLTVATAGDLPVGTIKKFDINGLDIAIANTDEGFFAVDDTCTHAEVSLAEGELNGCQIECWMHGANFDIRTGVALTPPATIALNTYPVQIVGKGETAEIQIKVSN